LAIAVPFAGGVLVASTCRVAKTPWGLVTGTGVGVGFERAAPAVAAPRRPGLDGVHATLGGLWHEPSEKASWLFSYEDIAVGGFVGLYRDLGDGPIRIGWGWVLASARIGEEPAGDVMEVLRSGELRLQWDLDRDVDLDSRFEALRRTFAWFRSAWEWVGDDIEVGIHESGHHYSVDRIAVRVEED